MITDLSRAGDSVQRRTDVLIIGAGVAGLFLAHRLRSQGIQTVVLESGGREQLSDTHPLNEAVLLGDPYLGAAHGRYRCLGGTSTRWGGALIPFSDYDFAPRPYLDLPGFAAEASELQPYLAEAERLFGLSRSSYEQEFVRQIGAEKHVPIGDPDLKTRFAKWPAFKRRNVAALLGATLDKDPELQIWLNATAVDFELDAESGRIGGVHARSQEGHAITVRAAYVVVCAGAIETTRLMLLLNRRYDERIFPPQILGRYLNDHISSKVARIKANDAAQLNRMAGFRFEGSTMRSLKFELSREAQMRERVGGAFAHISFRTKRQTGFDALRDLLRSLQQNGRVRLERVLDVLRDVPYLMRLVLWRAMYRQLFWPVPAEYELHVVAEQLPQANNRVTLAEKTDCFGLPLSAINWRISPDDLRTFTVFRRCFAEFWDRNGLSQIGLLDWTFDQKPELALHREDVFHPGGTTRMGTDGSSAIVDSNLRCFEVPNLWLSSTSVFPTGGGENPTLTLILFTLRLADHLCAQLRCSPQGLNLKRRMPVSL